MRFGPKPFPSTSSTSVNLQILKLLVRERKKVDSDIGHSEGKMKQKWNLLFVLLSKQNLLS